MADGSVSYKVYLEAESEAPEVRRFGVDCSRVYSFQYLKEKLQSVFPSLLHKPFLVYWRDSEGDSVVISSDEELTIALNEMNTDVRKLYVMNKPVCLNMDGDFEMNENFAKPEDGPAVHEGVTCDGCNKTVAGFRYKCIMCPDYDLCANCEGLGMHDEHFMIRIPKPIKWRPAFSRRIAHNMARSARNYDPYRYHGHHKRGSGARGQCGQSQDQSGGQCPFKGGPSWRGRHGSWLDYLANQLSEWTNLPGEFEAPSGSQEPAGAAKAAGSGSSENAVTAGPGAEASNSKPAPENQRDADYLRNVGNTVAALLNPLGIDVEIRTSQDVPKNTEEAKQDISNNSQEVGLGQTPNPPRDEAAARPSPQRGEPEQMEVAQGNPPAERESPESEGWTVLSQSGSNTDGQHLTAPQVGASNTQPSAPSQERDLYPALEEMVARTRQLELQANSSIRDPRVLQTLQQMLSMGFSNDGGWLTQLITVKNGDLESVLDVLQPVQK